MINVTQYIVYIRITSRITILGVKLILNRKYSIQEISILYRIILPILLL